MIAGTIETGSKPCTVTSSMINIKVACRRNSGEQVRIPVFEKYDFKIHSTMYMFIKCSHLVSQLYSFSCVKYYHFKIGTDEKEAIVLQQIDKLHV